MGKEKMSDWEDEIGAEWLGVRLDVKQAKRGKTWREMRSVWANPAVLESLPRLAG